MAVAHKRTFTPEEYLAREEHSEIRHEYINGEIFDMAGGTASHNLIVGNTQYALRTGLRKKPRKVFAEGLRLRIEKSNIITYPDVMVICGKIEFDRGRQDLVLNPIVLFEVMSKSTRHYDRTDKFAAYRQILSLQEYVMIEQERVYVECFRKTESRLWALDAYQDLAGQLKLESLGIELAIAELYQGIVEQGP